MAASKCGGTPPCHHQPRRPLPLGLHADLSFACCSTGNTFEASSVKRLTPTLGIISYRQLWRPGGVLCLRGCQAKHTHIPTFTALYHTTIHSTSLRSGSQTIQISPSGRKAGDTKTQLLVTSSCCQGRRALASLVCLSIPSPRISDLDPCVTHRKQG